MEQNGGHSVTFAHRLLPVNLDANAARGQISHPVRARKLAISPEPALASMDHSNMTSSFYDSLSFSRSRDK